MMRNIFVLAFHDLAVAFKNKTILLVLFIPLFIFVSLQLVDRQDADVSKIKIGLLQHYDYAPEILRSVTAAPDLLEVTWLPDEEEGGRLLKERLIDGVLARNEKEPGSLALLVLKKESNQTLAIVQRLSALQKAEEGRSTSWVTDVRSLHDADIQRTTLPTWILMLVLLVGFIILPAQVAEEKEKKLLLALLQTPITEVQWLIAKLIVGMALILMATLFLHLLGGFGPVHFFDYLTLIVLGSFCFSAYGIFLGFLCRNQASARTLGVVFYLPHLLPSALADFSTQMSDFAAFLPSFHLYVSLKSVLLEDGRIADMPWEGAMLFLVGAIMLSLSYFLMKRRWLM